VTELELWVESNYPDIYDDWVQSGKGINTLEDIEDWLEDNYHCDILDEYDDWLDGWIDWEEERTEEYGNE